MRTPTRGGAPIAGATVTVSRRAALDRQLADLVAGHEAEPRAIGREKGMRGGSEPDNCGQGGIKCIEPQDYIDLARQVIPVIREEDPEARVGMAPVVLFFDQDYLFTVLRSDVARMFDMIQWHGQFNVAPDNEFYGTYYLRLPGDRRADQGGGRCPWVRR